MENRPLKHIREHDVERCLVNEVLSRNGFTPKLSCPGMDGMPDRLILLHGGHMAFAELKAPCKRLRPQQLRRKHQLEGLGFRVYVIDHPNQIRGVLDEIQTP